MGELDPVTKKRRATTRLGSLMPPGADLAMERRPDENVGYDANAYRADDIMRDRDLRRPPPPEDI